MGIKKQFCPHGHDTFFVGREPLRGTCRECTRIRSREWNHNNKGRVKQQHHNYYVSNKTKVSRAIAIYDRSLFNEFFDAYGAVCQGPTGTGDCIHGGVADRDLLTVAHLWGNGNEHRASVGSTGTRLILLDLRKHGWPKDIGINVQCHNCQRKHLLIMLDFTRHIKSFVNTVLEAKSAGAPIEKEDWIN